MTDDTFFDALLADVLVEDSYEFHILAGPLYASLKQYIGVRDHQFIYKTSKSVFIKKNKTYIPAGGHYTYDFGYDEGGGDDGTIHAVVL